MKQLNIILNNDRPFLEVVEQIDNFSLPSEHIRTVLSGFFDWIVNDGVLVGIRYFSIEPDDVAELTRIKRDYIEVESGELTIWFSTVRTGENLLVQNFDLQLSLHTSGEQMITASLWNVDAKIVQNTESSI